MSRPALKAHTDYYSVSTVSSFPGVKRQGPEFNNSPSSSEEVKNECGYTSTAPVCLLFVDRNKFNFSLSKYFHQLMYNWIVLKTILNLH